MRMLLGTGAGILPNPDIHDQRAVIRTAANSLPNGYAFHLW